MSSLTKAVGQFTNCGPGNDNYELTYTCKGPSCSSLNGFENIDCNTDGGSALSCSTKTKCPKGIASYQSNFTFEQNAPDFLLPAPNQVDNHIRQQQDILVASCEKFSVKSDGTKQGTSVVNQGAERDCGIKVQSIPTPSSNHEPATVTAVSFKPSSTSKPQEFPSISSKRSPSKNMIFFTFLFGLMVLLPGVQAGPNQRLRREELRARANIQVRAVSDKVRTFATQFGTSLAEKANTQGENGEVFAHNLVADVVSSVCGAFFRGESVESFTPNLVGDCVKAIYGGDALPQPGLQFLAVFGASMLCDYAVSEAFPVAKDFFPDGCEGLQDLAQRISPSGTVAPSFKPTITPPPISEVPSSNVLASNLITSNAPVTNSPLSDQPETIATALNVPTLLLPTASNPQVSNTEVSDFVTSNETPVDKLTSIVGIPTPSEILASNVPTDVVESSSFPLPTSSNPTARGTVFDSPASVTSNGPVSNSNIESPVSDGASPTTSPPVTVPRSDRSPVSDSIEVASLSTAAEPSLTEFMPVTSTAPEPSGISTSISPPSIRTGSGSPSRLVSADTTIPFITSEVPSSSVALDTATLPSTTETPVSATVSDISEIPMSSSSEPATTISVPLGLTITSSDVSLSSTVSPTTESRSASNSASTTTPSSLISISSYLPWTNTTTSSPVPTTSPSSSTVIVSGPLFTNTSTTTPLPAITITSDRPLTNINTTIPSLSSTIITDRPLSNTSTTTPLPATTITSDRPLTNKNTTILTFSSTIVAYPPLSNISTTVPSPSITLITNPSLIATNTTAPPTAIPSCSAEFEVPDYCPGTGCTNLRYDRLNCGACGHVCDYDCSGSECYCQDFQTMDGSGHCHNITTTTPPPITSPTPCPTNFTMNLELGTCVPIATPIPTCLNETAPSYCPGVGCTSLLSDILNCGVCGNACQYSCYNGVCQCPDGQVLAAFKICNGTSTPPHVTTGPTCPIGSVWDLEMNECVSVETPTPTPCPSGFTPGPSGICTEIVLPSITFTSPPTPSSVPTAPSMPSTSVSPTSTPVPTSCSEAFPNLCGDVCVNLSNDKDHCGGCGLVCPDGEKCVEQRCLDDSAGNALGPLVMMGLGGWW